MLLPMTNYSPFGRVIFETSICEASKWSIDKFCRHDGMVKYSDR